MSESRENAGNTIKDNGHRTLRGRSTLNSSCKMRGKGEKDNNSKEESKTLEDGRVLLVGRKREISARKSTIFGEAIEVIFLAFIDFRETRFIRFKFMGVVVRRRIGRRTDKGFSKYAINKNEVTVLHCTRVEHFLWTLEKKCGTGESWKKSFLW
uniref:Uncharacterized protein n=1 Tax=Vespula pensylvanica TaxID=30213 RepID=A0A834UB45_VESPE|nr:hypothetical protein H0235_007079 [Vespula pensylvanica]